MKGKRIAFAALLSLALVACSNTSPTQPTSPLSTAAGALTSAQSRGRSGAAQLCNNGGYLTLVRTDGTGFRNVGECASHAARGGAFGNGGGSGNVIYTLRVSGTQIGDFGWSLESPTFIATTTSFTSFLSRSSSAGCTISSVTINSPAGANPFVETFFSPSCPGGGFLWSEFAQTFWNAGPFATAGVYVPQGVVSPVWTLTITQQ